MLPWIGYAALGLAVSMVAHFLSLFGWQLGGRTLFFSLHAGIIPLLWPLNMVWPKLTRRRTASYWTMAFAGCPAWLKYMTNGFFVYALVNLAVFCVAVILRDLHPAWAPAGGDDIVWRGFSGHWMAFYSAAMATFTTAHRQGLG